MQGLNILNRRLVSGLSALALVAGLGSGMGALAIVTAIPAAACNTEPYIGTICTFSFDWCPTGFVNADGRSLTIRENTALYGLVGFSYGGDGQNTFKVPDLRGRTMVGTGQGVGLENVRITQKFGQQQVVLTPIQVPVPPHEHPAKFEGTGHHTQTVTIPANPGSLGVTSKLLAKKIQGKPIPEDKSFLGQGGPLSLQAPIYVPADTKATTAELGGLEVKLTGTAGHGPVSFNITGITGGNVTVSPNASIPAATPVPTQPPSMGMTVCIATVGLYPNRP